MSWISSGATRTHLIHFDQLPQIPHIRHDFGHVPCVDARQLQQKVVNVRVEAVDDIVQFLDGVIRTNGSRLGCIWFGLTLLQFTEELSSRIRTR